ncbi:GNAT family N-acetyltransferase, partial [Escherichia coli]
MLVRRAQVEDLQQLSVLFDEYRQFYGASSNQELSYQFLKQRFEDQQTVIFINTKDDIFTGFILLYLRFSSVACSKFYVLDDVYITPLYRRHGAARQLIDTA